MIAAVDQALAAFLRAMGGPASYQRAEKALTLHMLEHLAPRYFAERKLKPVLDAALEALLKVPSHFGPTVDADESMARVDALYLRVIRGLRPRVFDQAQLKRACAQAGEEEGPLWAWLMGELAAPLGVAAPAEPWPLNRTLRLYYLTHVVLIDTQYLAKPAKPEPELLLALPDLIARKEWDLLAECVMCLARAQVRTPEAVAALRLAQGPDGRITEPGLSDRAGAHCTAAGLLALAGALDLERSAP